MTNLVKFSFRGIIATAFTPFEGSSAERLKLSVILDYAKHFLGCHYSMVLINGTYGEGMSMTMEEKIQVANAWTEAFKETKQGIIVQVGGTNLQDVKKLAAHTQSINATAILCLPELYYKPRTVEDLIDYLAEIGASAPNVPLFYYHSPDATGVNLNMVELFEKVENKIPTLVGIKFASTILDECTLAVKAARDRFRVIVANNYILPACVAIGVDTFMPTIVNVAPLLDNDIYSAESDNIHSAQTKQLRLINVLNRLSAIDKNVMPVMKSVARIYLLMRKFDIGTMRKPLKSYDSIVEESRLVSAIQNELDK